MEETLCTERLALWFCYYQVLKEGFKLKKTYCENTHSS